MLIKDKLKILLAVRDRPHHVAMSFSVGVFIGISPLLGLHTLLGILVSYLFRLNKFVTLMGVFVTNPWTIIPIYTLGTWAGMKMLRMEQSLAGVRWGELSLPNLFGELKGLVWPFVVGNFALGAAGAILSYLLLYRLLRRRSA
ncbi:MAG: DUF2062 domain-containing protein [Thermodesulfovibrionales bacterium]